MILIPRSSHMLLSSSLICPSFYSPSFIDTCTDLIHYLYRGIGRGAHLHCNCVVAMASSPKLPSVVILRLYRNLLRAAKPFTAPSPHARVMNCLISRTGIDDHISDWQAFVSAAPKAKFPDRARDLSVRYPISGSGISSSNSSDHNNSKEVIPPNRTPQRLFRRLLREVVCAGDQNGVLKSSWPSLVDQTILWNVIRREFRDGPSCQSIHFNPATRRKVAFISLRELNKKLSYLDHLETTSPDPLPHQAAWHVSKLPFTPSSAYLRPGAFLLSHPHMNNSYFSKTVICILEHEEDNKKVAGGDEDEESASKRNLLKGQQTYGLIVNRPSVNTETGKNRTLKDAFEEHMLPGKLSEVFGDVIVREGGPVHVALQMLHSVPASPEEGGNENPMGGRLIPMVPEGDETSTVLFSDRATYFQGEIFKAMTAVEEEHIDRDDVSFFVGASTWHLGQLQNEIAQGFWIPVRGPPEIALTGICELDITSSDNKKRPLADLWLSMMSACGPDEAKLAHLYFYEDHIEDNGLPCDAFEEEDIDS